MNMTYCAWVCDDESKKMRMYVQLAWPYLAVSRCDKLKLLKKNQEKTRKKKVKMRSTLS
jgi:hypothetical protein